MKHGLAAAIYLAMAGLASAPAAAQDWSGVEALREGDMKKLVFSEPQALPDIDVVDAAGAEVSLAAYRGQWVVLNFWATWCAPCRVEMPTLANLQAALAGQPVEVVTVATGRNSVQGIARFFDEIGVETLPQYRDPSQELARAMAVLGLPITVIVDPEGREVARLRGDAHWDSESAVAILEALASDVGS
ncbi:TlpA family protein disulfide reductase [Rhodovulum sp. 12E13]|uniref:TlpA family protein disulfide reductase n=1 Tax=Rhodovulum sp. 12E13 TaxID=2203891 RepID=UPI000E14B69A|nr:TlpA disulfide reductase family protein [Rhodovulum sp. 12E13]RDC72859.1 TlpA family protein disulfide reductase [Rhodovulum sp. 12E13]